jgi:signal transduction histidine kinase
VKHDLRSIFLAVIFSIILLLNLLYIVGFLSQAPYPGFLLEKDGDAVVKVFDPEQADKLQPGDQLISVDQIQISNFLDSLNLNLWQDVQPGEQVSIILVRDGEQKEISWTFTGQTTFEFMDRFFSPIWLAIFFWGCGVSAFLTIRPTDINWRLFLSLCFLLAIWFATFFGPAAQHYWYSPTLERISAWMVIPLLLIFHWQFPQRLLNTSILKFKAVGQLFLYATSLTFLFFDLSNPAQSLYWYGLLATLLIVIGLLLIRYLTQKTLREDLKLILLSSGVTFLVSLIATIIQISGIFIHPLFESFLYLGILSYPASILYSIWLGKLPDYQFRPNRYLAMVLYSILVILALMILLIILENIHQQLNTSISVLVAVAMAMITTQSYPFFKKLVDEHVFKIPVSSKDLLQSFSKQLDRTKDTASISSLMGDMVLPTLMVRQSALIELQAINRIRSLDTYGILESQVPTAVQVRGLVELGSRLIPPQTIRTFPKELHWIRVVLPLIFDDQIIGVWLLGQRDPNDFYDEYVIELLQALAQQTTIALIHHRKSQRLTTLYKANIDRDEEERAKIARNLHDDTLNDLALLQRKTQDPFLSDGINRVINSLRKTINGLRPEMLSYGLVTALHDLGDALNERQSHTRIVVQLDGAPVPISPNVEQHLYRIIQQACENSLRHSQADLIRILGIITHRAIHLTVVDNGMGFDVESTLDFSELIANRHFGLAGMHERADLINASLNIQSSAEYGTRISIYWKNPQAQKTDRPRR